MKQKIFIAIVACSFCSVGVFASTKTVKKTAHTIKKDTLTQVKPDTTKNQQNVMFPNPFIVFPSNGGEFK